jgi:hypothetical protein
MSRSRFAPVALGLALCAVLGAACGGGAPTQSGTRDDVREQLVDAGVESEAAGEVADCVSRGLFESGDFPKEERDDVLRASDGDAPDPALVERVETLVDGCAEEAGVLEEIQDLDVTGGEAQTGDEESSTTTEG